MRAIVAGRTLLLVGLGTLLSIGPAWSARADTAVLLPAGHGRGRDCFGNGVHNNTTITNHSPTVIRGVQNASNSNAGSSEGALNAFCKKKRHCRITQIGHFR